MIVFSLGLLLQSFSSFAQGDKLKLVTEIVQEDYGCFYSYDVIYLYPNAFGINAEIDNPYYKVIPGMDSLVLINVNGYSLTYLKNFIHYIDTAKYSHDNGIDGHRRFIVFTNDSGFGIADPPDEDTFTFYRLRKLLFQDFYQEVDSIKQSIQNELEPNFHGTWLVNGLKRTIEKGDTITLTRITENRNSYTKDMCIWEMDTGFYFKSYGNKEYDLLRSIKYEVGYENTFHVRSGTFYFRPNHSYLHNYGLDFNIINIEHNKIVLKANKKHWTL